MSGAYEINLGIFSNRLKSLYSHWENHNSDLYSGADAISVATPPPSDDLQYLKSSALHTWLFGYEFPETIMVFAPRKNQIHFLCTQKKASLLESVSKSAKEAIGADVIAHVKPKGENGARQIESILQSLRSDVTKVGYFAKESPQGRLLEAWDSNLKSSDFVTAVDVTKAISDLLASKDPGEILNVKKAAFLSAAVMRNSVVPTLEKTIDEETKVKHSNLTKDTEKAITDPSRVKIKLKAENVDICYPPIFQSGSNFDLRPNASSNDDNLHYESESVIICSVGAKYNNYCSNLVRTFLIDADSVQSKAYQVLLKAHQAAISALKNGEKASSAYLAALAVVERESPEIVGNLTKSAGTGIGLEFRESGSSLNARNDLLLRPGMVFNVVVGFQDLMGKSKKFSLLLADTVIVSDNGPPEVATKDSSKDLKDVAYSFSEGDEEEEEELHKVKTRSNGSAALLSKASLRSDNGEINREEIRRQHQAELAHLKNEETLLRLAGGGSKAGDDNISSLQPCTELVSYKNVNDIPPPRGKEMMMIQIDQKNESILLPIHGVVCAFHVATIKTLNNRSDTASYYVRIQFNVPSDHQGAICVKEISFRSKDSRHINEVVAQIKKLRQKVALRESTRAQRATLVSQEKLLLSAEKSRPIRLCGVWIRTFHSARGRKLVGSLECHVNGFRYTTVKDEDRIDIMFGNIKHAFFQPAENEMTTLIHFHLHNEIMVMNKKTKDVQFYVEVMEAYQSLGGRKRSAYDMDEIEEEERERVRKNKINMGFEVFVNRVNDIEFDQPLRELGFHGVPYKTTSFLIPTPSCLVELIETPFVVISLDEIEVVNLERVGLGQKNFDMAIVFKDFKKGVFRIDSIPTSSLEGIKEWMDTADIKYYEGRVNLNWKPILKAIADEPQEFIEAGGWEFLNVEASNSESDGSEDSDHGYEPSDVEEVSESDEDDSESESMEEESEEECEEEKGKTWEELEREASNADRERGDESDSDDERRRKKMNKRPKLR